MYSDVGYTTNKTSISGDSLASGETVTQTIYVKNTGIASLSLNLATNNWNPTGAGSYITVTLNQQATNLAAGQSIPAVVTLTVSPSITGITTFSYNKAISSTS